MKTLSAWFIRSIVSKIMMVLVLTAMVGSINVVPALGEDDHDRRGRHDNGRYEERGHGHGHDRDDRFVHGRRVYQPYSYRERYYAPPPIIYAPRPEPGISVFFPIR